MIEETIRVIKKKYFDIYIEFWRMELQEPPTPMISIRTKDGHYIDTIIDFTRFFTEYEIDRYEIVPDSQVCQIGLSTKRNKWYGWSHRAIFGFGIGHRVKKGDIAYYPDNFEEHQEEYCTFKQIEDYTGGTVCYETGRLCCKYNCPSYTKGKGEWVAETLDDCKLMAIHYSSGI
jgi:hypothetical protein